MYVHVPGSWQRGMEAFWERREGGAAGSVQRVTTRVGILIVLHVMLARSAYCAELPRGFSTLHNLHWKEWREAGEAAPRLGPQQLVGDKILVVVLMGGGGG